MFQNITENANSKMRRDDFVGQEENKINLILKEMFSFNNCIIYLLTFLVSMVSIKHEILPFGLAILAACMGGTVPIFMVYIVSLISTGIFHGGSGLASYFYTSLIFFLLVFVFKPKVSLEDRNEVFKVGSRLAFASFIYNLIKNIRGVFLVYDVFLGLVISALTYTFYKIFVNGIVVIRDFKLKKAFTVEELIAAALIIAIALSVFQKVTVFSLSISNILIIFVIMTLGWKNGMLIGGTAGLSIGLALTLIGNFNLLQLTVFAVSGILAGTLSYFGKIGVIVGFVLGNAILTYLANGNTVTIIYFREIFIAALCLLVVPSKFKIEIEELFSKEKMLDNTGERRFENYEEVKEKLDAVVDTISDMNNSFFVNNVSKEELKKEIYIDNFLNSFESYTENIFYEDVVNNEELIYDIFNCLKTEDVITEKMIIDCFKKYNNYILLRDQKIKDDLQELIKIANRTYRELQIKEIKNETKKEEAKKLKTELKNVTNIISKVSKEVQTKDTLEFENKEKEITILLKGKGYNVNKVDVNKCKNGKYIVTLNLEFTGEEVRTREKIANITDIISRCMGVKFSFQKDRKNLSSKEYIQVYSAEDKFVMSVGCSKVCKDGNNISGDSNLQMRLEDGKYLLAISDGMGSGKNARESSKFVVNTLNNLLTKGFEQTDVMNLINSELALKKTGDMYATVDMSILDLYKGEMLLLKNGACNTYIKNKKNVEVYNSKQMPVGIIDNIDFTEERIDLNEGDIILMCSDGLLESKDEIRGDWIQEFLKNINTNNVQKIADLILSEAIDNSFGIVKDDITVIVSKIIKKK